MTLKQPAGRRPWPRRVRGALSANAGALRSGKLQGRRRCVEGLLDEAGRSLLKAAMQPLGMTARV